MNTVTFNDEKKAYERRAALALLRFLETSTPVCDWEEPDFIFQSQQRLVGIEVTELQRAKSSGDDGDSRVLEAERIIVKRMARLRYISKGGSPLHVNVMFSANSITKRDRDRLATWLSDLVYDNQPSVNQPYHWDWRNYRYGDYPVEISRVSAYRLENGLNHHWPHNCAAFASSDAAETVATAILSKSAKHATYLRRCQVCWLLLVADVVKRGSVSLFDWSDCMNLVFRTPFERVFLMDRLESRIFELKIEKPSESLG